MVSPMDGSYLSILKNNVMKNTNKIITAFALGAAAGAAIGILFAPEKGSTTRAKIAEKGMKTAGDVSEMINKGKERYNDLKSGMARIFQECEEEELV